MLLSIIATAHVIAINHPQKSSAIITIVINKNDIIIIATAPCINQPQKSSGVITIVINKNDIIIIATALVLVINIPRKSSNNYLYDYMVLNIV